MTSPVKHFREFSDLNAYAAHIHELNLKWWQNVDGSPKDLDKGERFMLMVSELAEAMEGDRKDLMDDKLPQYKMLYVELADTVIRVLDSGHVYGWNFDDNSIWQTLDTAPKTMGGKLLNIVDLLLDLARAEILYDFDRATKNVLAFNIVVCCTELASASDFWQIVYEKLLFNWTRADHAHANRQGLPGQKRY